MQQIQEMIEGYRVSPQQARLWALAQSQDATPYLSTCVVRIKGELDANALEQAVNRVIARHEILRTTFHLLPGMSMPLQSVTASGWLRLDHLDLRGVSEPEQLARIEQRFEEVSGSAASLARSPMNSPLISMLLIRLADESQALLIRLPALLADAAGLNVLVSEIARAYAAGADASERDAEALQYADIAEWQNELLDDATAGGEYWRELDIAPGLTTELPFEKRAAELTVYAPKHTRRVIEAGAVATMERVASRHGVDLSSLMLACWQALIHRLTGQSQILTGVLLAGRNYEALERAIGLLARYVPVACRFDRHTTLTDLLGQIQDRLEQSKQWQETFSWDALADPIAAGSQGPFFPFTFEFEDDSAAFIAGRLTFSVERTRCCIDRAKLGLRARRERGQVVCELQYDATLFEPTVIERFAGHLVRLIDDAVRHPHAEVNALDLLSEDERRRLIVAFNDTASAYPAQFCFHELFEAQAARTPDAIALRCGEVELTYVELNARANRLARYLAKRGAAPETRVAVHCSRSVEMVVALLGVLKAGAAYVPLDTSYPADRLAFMMADSGAQILLTESGLREAMASPGVTRITLDADWPLVEAESAAPITRAAGPQNLAYVIYTSGSTGKPKGVMIAHGGLMNYLWWAAQAYRAHEGQGAPVHSPIGFDLTITALFVPLLVGQTVCLLAEGAGIEALTAALADGRDFSLAKLTPAHLELLGQYLPAAQAARSARVLVIGGESLAAERLAFWRRHAPLTRLINEYGPTETVVGCSVYEVTEQTPASGAVPIGRPIANTRLYVLNSHLRAVPSGVVGELYIGGDGVARGYLGRPDLTAERFIPDPFSQQPGARLYKTGDLARHLLDGNIDFLGRNDEQVKVRGYRIELAEVEAAISAHPAIRDAVVRACADAQGDLRLLAFVVAEDGAAINSRRLRGHLQSSLPDYMVPSTFVVMKALPMTPNGKIDRNALVAPAEIGDEEEGPTASNATPIEEMLAGMYADALGVARVGLQRSFFDLGGHSLMATRLLSRVREAFQVEIPLRGLFESPTVAGLAAVIEREIKAGHGAVLPPIERAPRDSDLPMSFAQQRLWFLNQLEPDVPIYNNPAFVRLVGNLNVTALHHTFTEIVRRHEALRTVFALKAGVPVQIIRPARPARIPLLDLSGLAPAQRETEVARLLPELGGTRFDLARGPLLQTALVRLADDDHLISVVMHHIITDGWSTGIFIRELAALYEAFAAGRPSPLTELDRQYADYAYWQRQWLQGDVLAAQLAYWERHLKGAPPLLEVPTDRPRPPLRSLAGEQQMIVIEAEIYDALRALSRQEGATLFMTMLAAFQVLLYRHTGQDDICTGTPIAGRNRIETEGLIGFFVNTLVLRTDLSGDPTFKELIARVREATLGALAHQDLPFEKIVEHLQPARSASYTPLFQVMFAVENVPEASIEVPGLTMTPMTGERLTSKFDMSFYIHETGSEILGVFEYSKDLYDAATIARLLAQYKTLLANIIAAPCGRLSELSVAAAADRHHAMAEFNQDLPAFEVTF